MQQQLMHNTAATTAFNSTTTSITTDHIQQYLDENKALILNILDNQNTGKFSECAENQSRLQHNLMYLAAIADSQPKPSSFHLQQQFQSQHMVPVPQSQMAFTQQTPFSVMQPQHVLQSQLGIGSSGIHTHQSLEGEGQRAFPDFSQSIFGDGLQPQGITKAASCSTAKETRSISSAADGDNPQKKGRLSRAAT